MGSGMAALAARLAEADYQNQGGFLYGAAWRKRCCLGGMDDATECGSAVGSFAHFVWEQAPEHEVVGDAQFARNRN